MTDATKHQADTAAAYDEAGVVAGKATLYALAVLARAEHPTARIVALSASDQGDWCIVDYVVTDEDDLADVKDLENDDGLASCLYTDVWRLRELYAQYDVRGQIEYTDRMGLTSFRMDVAKVLAELAPPPKEGQPERGSEGEARAVLEGIEVIVTRSAGADGAYVVFIDTEFAPDASDGGPGLRVNVNDHPTYEGKPYMHVDDKENR